MGGLFHRRVPSPKIPKHFLHWLCNAHQDGSLAYAQASDQNWGPTLISLQGRGFWGCLWARQQMGLDVGQCASHIRAIACLFIKKMWEVDTKWGKAHVKPPDTDAPLSADECKEGNTWGQWKAKGRIIMRTYRKESKSPGSQFCPEISLASPHLNFGVMCISCGLHLWRQNLGWETPEREC